MKKIGLFLFGICFALQMVAQEQNYFTNPVIRGDVPDPSVIRIEDTYYATGTSSEWAAFLSNVYLEGSGKLETGRACFYQATVLDF